MCKCSTNVPESQSVTSDFNTSSQLDSNRPPLPDVPAVYFVSPTLANIRRIAEDLEKSTYESFHLSFVEPLPRALLEELAASVAKDGTEGLVEQVCELNYELVPLGTYHLRPQRNVRFSTSISLFYVHHHPCSP